MRPPDPNFFSAALTAGAILTGFCGSFLAFRIQREASYFRQPALDFNSRSARDIFIGLSHFSASFLLLILATLDSMIFGFALPLLALMGVESVAPTAVSAGLLSALILICGYFWAELRHYGILSNRLLNERREWGSQLGSIFIFIGLAAMTFIILLFELH